jgi:hypothetical protein
MHDAKSVHAELVSIARERDRHQTRQARLLVQAEQLEIWRDFACAHIYDYLERYCDLQPRTAREYIRVARALAALPLMQAKLDDEDVRYSAVRELTRIATPETEAEWLRETSGMTAREIEDEVAGRARGDRPHDPKDPDRLVPLKLQVRESTYAMFVDARMRYVDEQGERLSDDALVVAMCTGGSDDLGDSDDSDAASQGGPHVPPYRLMISTCRSCARSFQITAGRELEVTPSMVALARCDARDIGDVESDLPQRALSSVTPRLREQVLARDLFSCTVPGLSFEAQPPAPPPRLPVRRWRAQGIKPHLRMFRPSSAGARGRAADLRRSSARLDVHVAHGPVAHVDTHARLGHRFGGEGWPRLHAAGERVRPVCSERSRHQRCSRWFLLCSASCCTSG